MIDGNPIIAIVRSKAQVDLDATCSALFDGGLSSLELTLTTPGCLDAIARIRAKVTADQRIGCGSITNVQEAKQAYEAGAQFLVTPFLEPETIAYAKENRVLIAAGAFTPTEIAAASQLGADLIKVFPADALGPAYFRSILAPLPNLRLMPTGGVTLETMDAWHQAGAVALGAGSALVKPEWLLSADYTLLRKEAERWSSRTKEW